MCIDSFLNLSALEAYISFFFTFNRNSVTPTESPKHPRSAKKAAIHVTPSHTSSPIKQVKTPRSDVSKTKGAKNVVTPATGPAIKANPNPESKSNYELEQSASYMQPTQSSIAANFASPIRTLVIDLR